ncbi:MAG TPA: hypothetical protein PLL30_17350 [Candidatus Krumholzibacteria bacterium]|nr:hypothetical protein [Candidatus Krumholzibacteria bacterium]HPD73543.1 hypothetical protein [Candidatus Krumholzibacteria bacterium]HRY42265.1 hypothetical protein [Candidatus Krumholzibacteria bacterium]
MSNRLDREGIFMARAKSWLIRTFDNSEAVAVNIEFQILGQLNDQGGWDDWRQYDEHTVYGMFFIVKKDGTINTTTMEQLAKSLGWDGNLLAVMDAPPPKTAVQITVKADEYQGKVTYKASWINPKDFSPQPQGASDAKVSQLQARFGSLLRAAAAAAKQSAPVAAAPSAAANQSEPAPFVSDDDLPF